ncbi:PIN domain-containing protein [Actinacidiphila bryophytorum]|nr:hypothetical protein [Actinacidiphila bryophytorum]MBM9437187.1 hypothetical protein [Actinacidiphila bryophytorum]MBN6543243.1 hypothetical protein [Actinacidiphila bryophytorum]
MAVSAKTIRQWINRRDNAHLLSLGTEKSLLDAADRLAYIAPGNDATERKENALKLLSIIIYEVIRASSPGDAIALSTALQQARIGDEGERTRASIESARSSLESRFNANDDFDNSTRTLNNWRREEAVTLRDAWPSIATVVREVTQRKFDRGELLAQWASHQPAWYAGAPAAVHGWLGRLAADYDEHEAAFSFYESAISNGIYPRGYWQAIASFALGGLDEQRAKDYALQTSENHPLLDALKAAHQEEWATALNYLDRWQPEKLANQAIKRTFEARLLHAAGQNTRAINVAIACAKEYETAGSNILAAELLLMRATQGETEHNLADSQSARSHAMLAVHARRSWFGDSVEPLVLAIKSALAAGAGTQAWSLCQATPQGEAWQHELDDQRLKEQAALTAAVNGLYATAQTLLEDVDNEFSRVHIEALIMEGSSSRSENIAEVQAQWRSAWSLAQSDGQRITAAMGIAESGGELPDLTELMKVAPKVIEEIQLVSRVLRSPGDTLAALKANALKSRVLVIKLAERHSAGGDDVAAAKAIKAGADHWNDPNLMSMAAHKFAEAGNTDDVRETATTALNLGGKGWDGAKHMYALLVQVEFDDGKTDKAVEAARSLLSLDSHDKNARWALVKALFLRGQVFEAWKILSYHGDPITPRDRDEAKTWLWLGSHYSEDPDFIGKTIALMRDWPNDEEMLGIFIQTLNFGLRGDQISISAEDREMVASVTRGYLERFPDSDLLRTVEPGPDDDPLVNMAPLIRAGYEHSQQFADIQRPVMEGKFPIGMLAAPTGKSLTELSLRRVARHVYAIDLSTIADEVGAVGTAQDNSVIIDPTAVHTLALLAGVGVEQLIGGVSSLLTTDQLFRDALQAQESVGISAEVTIGWDEEAEKPKVYVEAPGEGALRAGRSAQIVQIMESMARVPRRELKCMPELRHQNIAWLTGLDYAIEHEMIYWSDDRAMRYLARDRGVPSFGTYALLEYLKQAGSITHEEHVIMSAELLRNEYFDFPFSSHVFEAAAVADSWQARGAAQALTLPSSWSQAPNAVAFVIKALSHVSQNPVEVTNWTAAVSVGLIRATPEDSTASNNLEILLRQLMGQSWFGRELLPHVLTGIRAGVAEREGVADPVESVFTGLYQSLVRRNGHQHASAVLIGIFSLTADQDKALAARIILTARD